MEDLVEKQAGSLSVVATLLLASFLTAQDSHTPLRKVAGASDLPRFSYPMPEAPSSFLLENDATFNAFAISVLHDVDGVLTGYEIQDPAIVRRLYAIKHNVAMLIGDNASTLATGAKLKQLADTPQSRETSGLLDYPLVLARTATHSTRGPSFDQAFDRALRASLDTLDWQLAGITVRRTQQSLEMATPELLAASEKRALDSSATQTHSVGLGEAETMIEDRTFISVIYPLKSQALPILSAYLASHSESSSQPTKSKVIR